MSTSKYLPNLSYLGWKIAVTVFHIIATSTTIYRLVHRFRIRRLWWDDYLLFAALIVDTVFWPIYWVRSPQPATPSPDFIKKQRVLNSYWLTMFMFIFILWSCRAVMALSLVRIFPPGHKGRRWSYFLVGVMAFGSLVTLLTTTVTCKAHSALLVASEMTNCAKGVNGIVIKNTLFFVTDCISDLLLIITPLVFFWRMKLPVQERRLILIFSLGSTLTLAAAVLYMIIANSKTVASLKKNASLINLGLAATEAAMSLIAANVVVVSTCFYQALHKNRAGSQAQELSGNETTVQGTHRHCTCIFSEQMTLVPEKGMGGEIERSDTSSEKDVKGV